MRALAALGLLCASLPALTAGIAGSWRGELKGTALQLVFDNGGTGTLNGDAIQYKLHGQQLLIDRGGVVTAYGVTLQDERMTVTGGGLEAPVLLRREAAAAARKRKSTIPTSASVRAELAGRWCHVVSFTAQLGGGSQSSRCFELDADGRYRYHGENSTSAYSQGNQGLYGGTASSSQDAGRWSADADTLIAQSDSGRLQRYALTLRNHPKNRDPMICLDGECYATFWKKAPW